MARFIRRALWAAALAVPGVSVSSLRAGPFQHVLVVSIDGLHESDLRDPAVNQFLPNITSFANSSIQYTGVHSVTPSDSFPTTLAMFTGAGPATTGVYYDDTYNRTLYAPGSGPGASPGTEVPWTGDINKQSNLIEGAPFGNSNASSIDVNKLPLALVNGSFQPVYPHNYLQVHTVFEVAHNAGLQTAWIDKHPSYEILNGPSGTGLSDFYAPDVDARASLSGGLLVDNASANKISKNLALSKAYDDLRVSALLNQMQGRNAAGTASPGVPAIFGMNLIALNTSHKDTGIASGISLDANGNEFVGLNTQDALRHVDADFAQILSGLRQNGLAQNTLVVLTAKNADSPRIGKAVDEPTSWLINPLEGAGIQVAQATQDDVALLWLKDQSQTELAAQILAGVDPTGTRIESVLSGPLLTTGGFADPLHNDRSPDIVVALAPGVVITDSSKRSEHGGFSEDDTHIPLVLGGGIDPRLAGSIVYDELMQTQLAPTILEALGLDPSALDGAVADGTLPLPGTGIPVPEPVSGALLLGLGGLLLRRRQNCRRRGSCGR